MLWPSSVQKQVCGELSSRGAKRESPDSPLAHAPLTFTVLQELLQDAPDTLFTSRAVGELLFLHGKAWERKKLQSYSPFEQGYGAQIGDSSAFNDAQDCAVGDVSSSAQFTDAQVEVAHGGNECSSEETRVFSGNVSAEVCGQPINAVPSDLSRSNSLPPRHGATIDGAISEPPIPRELVGAPFDLENRGHRKYSQNTADRDSVGFYIDHSKRKAAQDMAKTHPVQGISLADAVEAVVKHWQETDAIAVSSQRKFTDLLRRYVGFAAAYGSTVLSEQTEELAAVWINSLGHDRSKNLTEPAPGTISARRAALRRFYKDARHLNLSAHGLVINVPVPPRPKGAARPLTDEEVRRIWMYAADSGSNTRRPVVFALLLSGVHTSEAGFITPQDVDVVGKRVWAHGDSSRVTARWLSLEEPYLTVVLERIEFLRQHCRDAESFMRRRLTNTHNGGRMPGQEQNRIAAACVEVFKSAGIERDAYVTPQSVQLSVGARKLNAGESIGAVAKMLGYNSLDSCATALRYDWQAGESV